MSRSFPDFVPLVDHLRVPEGDEPVRVPVGALAAEDLSIPTSWVRACQRPRAR